MVGEKRKRAPSGPRRANRARFRAAAGPTVHRRDLGNGLRGVLVTCEPKHEKQCFRDAVVLLSRFVEEEEGEKGGEHAGDVAGAVAREVAGIVRGDGKLFSRVEVGVNGSVFVKVAEHVGVEGLVERCLREAKKSGSPGARHCIRVVPVLDTCYAKVADVVKVAVGVAGETFPRGEKGEFSYAIVYRSRMNTDAHRDEYIPAIAKGVEDAFPGVWRVDLTKPDVTLIVEVLKTSCCVGSFRHYFELAKLNLREAANPSVPNQKTSPKEGKETQGVASSSTANKAQGEAEKHVTNAGARDCSPAGAKNEESSSAQERVVAESAKESVLEAPVASEPRNAKSAHVEISSTEASGTEPAAAAPEMSEPAATAPEMSEPAAAGGAGAEPVAAKPNAAGPATAKPDAAESAVGESASEKAASLSTSKTDGKGGTVPDQGA